MHVIFDYVLLSEIFQILSFSVLLASIEIDTENTKPLIKRKHFLKISQAQFFQLFFLKMYTYFEKIAPEVFELVILLYKLTLHKTLFEGSYYLVLSSFKSYQVNSQSIHNSCLDIYEKISEKQIILK